MSKKTWKLFVLMVSIIVASSFGLISTGMADEPSRGAAAVTTSDIRTGAQVTATSNPTTTSTAPTSTATDDSMEPDSRDAQWWQMVSMSTPFGSSYQYSAGPDTGIGLTVTGSGSTNYLTGQQQSTSGGGMTYAGGLPVYTTYPGSAMTSLTYGPLAGYVSSLGTGATSGYGTAAGYGGYALPTYGAYGGYSGYTTPTYGGYGGYTTPTYGAYGGYTTPTYGAYSAYTTPTYGAYGAYAAPAYGGYAAPAYGAYGGYTPASYSTSIGGYSPLTGYSSYSNTGSLPIGGFGYW